MAASATIRMRAITSESEGRSTPNSTDEYSLSYSGNGQEGRDALHRRYDRVAEGLAVALLGCAEPLFLSNTKLGDTAYVKTKLYYNSFRNGLYSFDNANYNTQATAKAFNSYYSDYAYGGSVEAGNNFGNRDT